MTNTCTVYSTFVSFTTYIYTLGAEYKLREEDESLLTSRSGMVDQKTSQDSYAYICCEGDYGLVFSNISTLHHNYFKMLYLNLHKFFKGVFTVLKAE